MYEPIAALIHDFRARKWKSDPFERMLLIARDDPEHARQLAHAILAELPESGTFFHACLSYVALDDFPELVNKAKQAFQGNRKHTTAESVFHYTSLQCVTALHPHLDWIFEREPNKGAFYQCWPWRESGTLHREFLTRVIEDEARDAADRRRAWMCMLETREPDLIQEAFTLIDRIDLDLQMRQFGLPDALQSNDYLRLVGVEESEGQLRRLIGDRVWHLMFPPGYFTEERPEWLQRSNHPTWGPRSDAEATVRFGGRGDGACGRCGAMRQHLITLPGLRDGLVLSSAKTICFETCLACLGWEEHVMFYQHDEQGVPRCLAAPGDPPQFPVADTLREAQVGVACLGERWKWQSWGSSNSRENLNRVGGEPCWIQDAEYPAPPMSANDAVHFATGL